MYRGILPLAVSIPPPIWGVYACRSAQPTKTTQSFGTVVSLVSPHPIKSKVVCVSVLDIILTTGNCRMLSKKGSLTNVCFSIFCLCVKEDRFWLRDATLFTPPTLFIFVTTGCYFVHPSNFIYFRDYGMLLCSPTWLRDATLFTPPTLFIFVTTGYPPRLRPVGTPLYRAKPQSRLSPWTLVPFGR